MLFTIATRLMLRSWTFTGGSLSLWLSCPSHLVSTIITQSSVLEFCFLRFQRCGPCSICLSDIFHLAYYPQGIPILLLITSISSWINVTFPSFIHQQVLKLFLLFGNQLTVLPGTESEVQAPDVFLHHGAVPSPSFHVLTGRVACFQISAFIFFR